MRAWTGDADDLRVEEDLDEPLLYRTPKIDSFLAPDRDDKSIDIGTKGFDKTLLRKAACLVRGNLLDKPIGAEIFGHESLAFFSAAPLPWAKVWLAAMAWAVLEHAGETEGLKVSPKLMGLILDANLHGVIDHFVGLLDLTPSELRRCTTDNDGHLVPRLRAPKSPVTIFIDGEYVSEHVEDVAVSPSVTGELSPNVWYFSQLRLVDVAHRLRRINHHLKVFNALRKEAVARLPQRMALVQQYRGSVIDIVYSPQSLRGIFVNNVRPVKIDRMVPKKRSRTSPLEAFLGRTSLTEPSTREEQDALEHVCRHSLPRSRDLMTIGECLAALRPDERRNEHRNKHRIKEAVNGAANQIAHGYLTEIAPYLGQVDLARLLQRLPGHSRRGGLRPALARERDCRPGDEKIFNVKQPGAAEPDLWVRR